MSLPHRSVNVRLQPQLAEAFQNLCNAVDLPRAVIMRALLQDQLLCKNLDEQIEIVTKQIFKSAKKTTNRMSGLNASKAESRLRAKD
jgi:hypothetical protein